MAADTGHALFLATLGILACGAEPATPDVDGISVELSCGTRLALSAEASTALAEGARWLLQSSQSNSGEPDWSFPSTEVEEEYRAALVADHLRVRYPGTRRVARTGQASWDVTVAGQPGGASRLVRGRA